MVIGPDRRAGFRLAIASIAGVVAFARPFFIRAMPPRPTPRIAGASYVPVTLMVIVVAVTLADLGRPAGRGVAGHTGHAGGRHAGSADVSRHGRLRAEVVSSDPGGACLRARLRLRAWRGLLGSLGIVDRWGRALAALPDAGSRAGLARGSACFLARQGEPKWRCLARTDSWR